MFKILFATLFLSTVCLSICLGDSQSFETSKIDVLNGEEGQFAILIRPPLEVNKVFILRVATTTPTKNKKGISLKLSPPTIDGDWRDYYFTVKPSDGKVENDVQRYTIDFRAEEVTNVRVKVGTKHSLAKTHLQIRIKPSGATKEYN